jgi:tetratricopeptide (TPR) repeat protein
MAIDRFNEALSLHKSGQLPAAMRIYKKILKRESRHFDALHHLGMLEQAEGQLDHAKKSYLECLVIDPSFGPLYNSLTSLFLEIGDLKTAIEYSTRSIELNPTNYNAYFLKARVLLALGQPDDALAAYHRALFFNPRSQEAHNNMGNIYMAQGSYDLAISAFGKAINLHPAFATAYANRASAYSKRGLLNEACIDLERAVNLEPANIQFLLNLAALYDRQFRHTEALATAQKAFAQDPKNKEAIMGLAWALFDMGDAVSAERYFSHIIKIDPSNRLSWNGYGVALKELQRFDDAAQAFSTAMAGVDKYDDAQFNLACLTLLQGDLPKGFELYEARKTQSRPVGNMTYAVPEWSGIENLAGKTILIHEEQGLGDTIQFCRYLPLISKMGAKILFGVEPKMRKLIGTLDCEFEFVDPKTPHKIFDFRCALLSLPKALKTDLTNIPNQTPYLSALTHKAEYWKEALNGSGLKIGICWQGSRSKIDIGRSMPLLAFQEIANVPGVRLISLQKGHGQDQLHERPMDMKVETLGPTFDSGVDAFEDTAAVMSGCDLIITSDTAIAHLAGSLGVNTWVALRAVPDWRWMLESTDSPWYPTMKLFRQSVAGDWTSVFEDMVNELRQLLNDN